MSFHNFVIKRTLTIKNLRKISQISFTKRYRYCHKFKNDSVCGLFQFLKYSLYYKDVLTYMHEAPRLSQFKKGRIPRKSAEQWLGKSKTKKQRTTISKAWRKQCTEGIQKLDPRWELRYFLDRFDLSLKFLTEFWLIIESTDEITVEFTIVVEYSRWIFSLYCNCCFITCRWLR